MSDVTPVFCKKCSRVVWSTHVDKNGMCCNCGKGEIAVTSVQTNGMTDNSSPMKIVVKS